jgi:dihydroorotase
MKILLKNVKIVAPHSPFHGTNNDILIDGDFITDIGRISPQAEYQLVEGDQLSVSIGWFDLGAKLGDPGLEHKEDLNSGLRAAMQGGFTDLACLPNTKPVIQTKENIHYLLSKARSYPVTLHIIAAASVNLESKAMTEIFDLEHAGAVAFSDGSHAISNSGLVVRLLQYLSQLDSLLILHSEEKSMTEGGVMNEGVVSVYLGQKGMPSLAEEIMVQRNLALLEYAGGKIHFSKVSSLGAVNLIREAKKKGANVTCDVAVANLIFDETSLVTFDTNFKTNPPLRAKMDQDALWEGLADGTIDIIITDHDPQDEESKKLEFDLAEFGMIQLETAFALLNESRRNKISLEQLLSKFTVAPRQLLGIEIPKIEVGAKASLTVFDTQKEWVYQESSIQSKSRNSPVLGQNLVGKPIAIFNKGQFIDLRN